MDTFSRKSGPRREDERARKLINENSGTIRKLADQISNGAYSASQRAAKQDRAPAASGLIVSDLGAGRKSAAPRPYVRVSLNRRVVIVDAETSRQMHHVGDIRRVAGEHRFVLATRANGFFSPLDDDLEARLAPLDQAPMGGARTDRALAYEVADRLDLS